MPSAPWRIALASAVGTSHERCGAPCQDSAALAEIDTATGPVLAAAVSDGAGSAPHSDLGSSLAVNSLIALARSYFEDGGALQELDRAHVCRWMRDIAEKIASTALASGHHPRDYSCTLLVALVGVTHAAFAQIGDGAIVVSHGEADGWSYVFWPQHGEYANTTNFIQSPNLDDLFEFELAPRGIGEFAIFSDGIENLVMHKAERSVHQGFFRDMMRPVRESAAQGLDPGLSEALGKYLSSAEICERTDDDKTLILATRAVVEDAKR
jgi:hypothetical protein